MSMPPVANQPAGEYRPAASSTQRLQGSKFYRGIRASTSGKATARQLPTMRAGVSAPTPTATSTPVSKAASSAPNVAKGMSSAGQQAASQSIKQSIAQKMTTSAPAKAVIPNVAKLSPIVARAAPLAAKMAGPIGTAASLVTPSGKTEPGNPVFRKTDAGKTSVAGYRSSTTPRPTDTNTQTGMVGSMARRGGLAPSVKNQELPSKISPATTKEPGTLSAPAPKPATSTAAPKTFGQAFSAARKEAGSGKGQFEFGGKKFQTNIAPAKGAEKYIAPSAQKVTSVGKSSTATPGPDTKTDEPPKSTPEVKGSVSASPSPPQERPDMPHKGSEWKSGMEPIASNPDNAAKATGGSPSSSLPSMAKPGAGASNDAEDGKKKMAALNSLKEEVQVGDYKYRIV